MSATTEPRPTHELEAPIEQRRYLIGGVMREWAGEVTDVFSTISDGESYSPTRLGSIPDMGEAEALEALDAAMRAYD